MPLQPIGPVIAGVDESPVAAAVVDLAAREAAAHGAPLVLVHAAGSSVAAAPADGPLEAALARVRRAHPGCAVTTEVAVGDPADALVARSAAAGMLVLGRSGHSGHGRRPDGASRRGSVTLSVLGRAHAPVLVCRGRGGGARRPAVLVGVDGMPESEPAVEFGFAEAALRGAPLIAMHIWPHGTGRADAEGGFLNLLENWSGKYPDVPVELAVRHGLDPAIVLAAASRSACLAVVGAPCEPAGARRVSPNSALAAFIDRAGCPVAVVPRRVGRGA